MPSLLPEYWVCLPIVLVLLLVPAYFIQTGWRERSRIDRSFSQPEADGLPERSEQSRPVPHGPEHPAAGPLELNSAPQRRTAALVVSSIGILLLIQRALPWDGGPDSKAGGLPLIALAITGLGVYLSLGTLNPTVDLRLGRHPLILGEASHVHYRLSGNLSRLKHLMMALRAYEQAPQGDGTVTQGVWSLMLVDSSDPTLLRHGEVVVDLPLTAMPSLKVGPLAITWYLEVYGAVDGGPDIQDRFAVTVEAAPCSSST